MDLSYLISHPETIDRLLEHQRIRVTTLSEGGVCNTSRLTLDDGTHLFAKERPGAPEDFFPREAACLEWLAEAGAVRTPDVIAATPHTLVLEWIEPGKSSPKGAEKLGRDLAALHASRVDTFGAPWQGYIGSLPLDNRPLQGWTDFYVERRCHPFLVQAHDAGTLSREETAAVDKLLGRLPALAGPPEQPSRIHGDLWGGNVHYDTKGEAWLIDAAAAHGGHRETDLACLQLFGTPHFPQLFAAYNEALPLSEGWQERVGLHQLHLLLVHCVLFGRSYVPSLLQTVRKYL